MKSALQIESDAHNAETQTTEDRIKRQSANRQRRASIVMALAIGFGGVGLIVAAGCHENEAHTMTEDAREFGDLSPLPASFISSKPSALPAVLQDADGGFHVPGDDDSATELICLADASSPSIRWNFGGFDPSLIDARTNRDEAIRLIQAPAVPPIPDLPEGFGEEDEDDPVGGPAPVSKSASDIGPVEMVPTPPAVPEVKAELIPTPTGFPEHLAGSKSGTDPVARIAADVANKGDTGMAKAAAEEKLSTKPALIDPTEQLGLVGTQAGPEDFKKWPKPEVTLFVTGDQHGYIEPCGCTGLEKQKGGVARRFTFMEQLRSSGWNLIPIDAGNQIRRIGPQAAIKLQKSVEALKQMKYQSVGFGPADMRVGSGELISVAYADSPENVMFVSGNVVLIDPMFVPSHKIVKQGEFTIGMTSILDPESLTAPTGDDITVNPIKKATEAVLKEMTAAGANFKVVTFFGTEDAAKKLMADVPGFDLIVASGGYGEPTYRPEPIAGSEAQLIITGNKGMYAGLVGLYNGQPLKYVRVPLSHEFADAPAMRKLMADYQQQLEQLGLGELTPAPIPHPSGDKYVGTATCAKCHTSAMEVWESSDHALATEHIVKPTEQRGDVPRHFDPECISCHVTGWNPQKYYPYETGYESLEKSAHLLGNGCENCHGPGAKHSAAEADGSDASEERKKSLRLAMQLPLEKAKEHCMSCHDLDNSPDFHNEDAFEDEYWPMVEHYGTD